MNEMKAICVKYCFARSLFRGGSTVLPLIAKKVPSIIILDVMMPGMDELGADDYLVKPFLPKELLRI